MRRFGMLLVLTICCSAIYGQFAVSYHQSNLPFLDFSYEIKERFRPAIRVGTDAFVEEMSFEGVVTFDILDRNSYEFYGGVGARFNVYNGIVVPLGMNFYPFDSRNFGFHMEMAPILSMESILRASWGIRYVFSEREL